MTDAYLEKKAFYDRVLTIYGRKPVLEALRDPTLDAHCLHLADSNRRGGIVDEIVSEAQRGGITIRHHGRAALSRISRNGRQDQGVALDILCPSFARLEDYLAGLKSRPAQRLLALDGISNPQNLGMILRSASAGFIDGILWSPRGNAALGPLVLKSSAGTLYRAPLLKCEELLSALADCRAAGCEICTLVAGAPGNLFDHRPKQHCVYVLGNETEGVSPKVARLADTALSIPMRNGVESLNVAVAASLIAFAGGLAGRDC